MRGAINPVPGQRQLWIVVAVLIAINVLGYATVSKHNFVNFDDPGYVYENPHVSRGLTWAGVIWAFTTSDQANWHPLTWLSHMLDVELFGVNPGPHHLTNLFFHILNTLLVFWLFFQLTAAIGPSSFIAALFAVHPLHVESVAWIAERKDMLSALFWMLTMLAYVFYVRQPRWTRYVVMVLFFALGLMAKPMLVTLPFVLLLLDSWPLGRAKFKPYSNVAQLIREKIPLFILAVLSSVITVFVQNKGGAIRGLQVVPFSVRMANALVAYCTYLWKAFWPSNMIILYPFSPKAPNWWPAAAIFVIGFSIVALVMARRRPYIPVGWFWFLGTLVPVIGLVQVGNQSMADRYTYIPLLGLFLIVSFGATDVAGPHSKRFVLLASLIAIGACIWLTRTQLSHWRDGRTLWEHEISIADNAFARVALGNNFALERKPEQAIPHYAQALRQEYENPETHYVLAKVLSDTGKPEDAFNHYSECIRLAREGKTMDPVRLARAYYSVGLAFASQGKSNEAATQFAEAVRANPDYPQAYNDLGVQYFLQGKIDEAIANFRQAVQVDPAYAIAHNSLGTALANKGRTDDAIAEYSEAVRLVPGYAEAHANLGILLATHGKPDDAMTHLSEAVRINPNDRAVNQWLADLKSKRAKTP
jgi:protein O-mannosyl-transferase